MRKVMLLAAMLAMVLAAAAPVFAQSTEIDGDENEVTNEGADTQYNAVCQNIIGSIGDITQNQSGQADAVSNASATADDDSEATADSEAVAEVAQEQGVTIEQVNECLNDFDVDDDGVVDVDETVVTVSAAADDEGSASAAAGSASAAAGSASAAAEVLPETGGASLLALGAGALLVAGGLVARRIVR
jgi:hypothetical protein